MSEKVYVCNKFPMLVMGNGIRFINSVFKSNSSEQQRQIETDQMFNLFIFLKEEKKSSAELAADVAGAPWREPEPAPAPPPSPEPELEAEPEPPATPEVAEIAPPAGFAEGSAPPPASPIAEAARAELVNGNGSFKAHKWEDDEEEEAAEEDSANNDEPPIKEPEYYEDLPTQTEVFRMTKDQMLKTIEYLGIPYQGILNKKDRKDLMSTIMVFCTPKWRAARAKFEEKMIARRVRGV